jgi:hypothetical protein
VSQTLSPYRSLSGRAITEHGTPERVAALVVTPSYFSVFGITPVLGRPLAQDSAGDLRRRGRRVRASGPRGCEHPCVPDDPHRPCTRSHIDVARLQPRVGTSPSRGSFRCQYVRVAQRPEPPEKNTGSVADRPGSIRSASARSPTRFGFPAEERRRYPNYPVTVASVPAIPQANALITRPHVVDDADVTDVIT